MKKFLFTLLPLLLIGCTKTVYVDSVTNEPVRAYAAKDYIDLIRVDNHASSPGNASVTYEIYVDRNTDVLYTWFHRGISPIMKADGTCLTYTEWKEIR